ncbi:MAG TPA: ceramidase domain-containing protein [Candidatus Acidoferrum sp.]|nr:ceramidase domain-containing protein [Candidatus Acidoferrum sp.]
MISRRAGRLAFLVVTVVFVIAAALSPRFPQPLSYHDFADRRGWLGIPNFGNVVSNLPFFVIGACGLWLVLGSRSPRAFLDRRERWAYALAFLGFVLTAFGSSYYHGAPDNARLVWDRLPMTLVFMPLVAAVIAERISLKAGLWLLPLLTATGVASVWHWQESELQGQGDLRLYAAVQLYALAVLLLALLLPPKYTRGSYLLSVVGFYVLAKVLETADRQVFVLTGGAVSGHTLKHLAAALAGYVVLRMLQQRAPLAVPADPA